MPTIKIKKSNKPWHEQYSDFKHSDWQMTPAFSDPQQESQFKTFLMGTPTFGMIKQDAMQQHPNITDNDIFSHMTRANGDYDYRGAWLDNQKTQVHASDGLPHWSSTDSNGRMLKSPNHPTAWKEFFMRGTGQDPYNLGIDTMTQAKMYNNVADIINNLIGSK